MKSENICDHQSVSQTTARNLDDLEFLYPDNIVELEATDPINPLGWSIRKKIFHTVAFGFTTFASQFSISVLSPAVDEFKAQFGVNTELGILAFSIYILGNAVGPMIFAPISEIYGRKVGVFAPFIISAFLMIVIADLSSFPAILVFRFLAGVFGSAPVVSSGGAMADMWAPKHRPAAMVIYSLCIVSGSSCSPILGALLIDTGANGWRWCSWLGGILGLLMSLVNMVILDETYMPVLNTRKALEIRLDTGHWEFHAKHEEWKMSTRTFLTVHCARPILLFLTPIVCLMATYGSFAYGVMFLIISSVGNNFTDVKGWTGAKSYLPILGIPLGFMCGGLVNIWNGRRYGRIAQKLGRNPPPEERLIAMMLFNWTLPAGAFIYAWTLREDVHWVAPTFGIMLIGCGVCLIFQGCLVYIVDAYTRYAASGFAANTILRSLFGFAFPLFANKLFGNLGISWGGSVIGLAATIMVPIPWLFYFFSNRIRKHSPFEHLIS